MRHYLPNRLLEREIHILLIGCGGTGSQILTDLARMDRALRIGFDHPGISVTTQDHDIVSEANVGRQLFYPEDVGRHKSVCLTTRINQAYGTDWNTLIGEFEENDSFSFNIDIVISATDNPKSRLAIAKSHIATYWLDTGNTKQTGQAILGTLQEVKQPTPDGIETIPHLPTVCDLYNLKNIPADDTPSCSLAEAISKQDLYINKFVGTCAVDILWQGLRQGYWEYHGAFVNTKAGTRITPLPVDPKKWESIKKSK